MIIPNPNYRLDPDRAIHINGRIGPDMVTQLAPEILKLQRQSRKPISVNIDSPGGMVSSMESILRLLKVSDQDSSKPCQIITTVILHAASAATDLLASGDYATAYPTSTINYRGLRFAEDDPLTIESTSRLLGQLRWGNDMYAWRLAEKIEDRFRLIYARVWPEFPKVRVAEQMSGLTDFDCFLKYIQDRLSFGAKRAWYRALNRYRRYEALFEMVNRPVGRVRNQIEFEGKIIKTIVGFEIKAHKKEPDWTFSVDGGIEAIVDDFFLLREYFRGSSPSRLRDWFESLGKLTIPKEKTDEIEAIQDPEARQQRLEEEVSPVLRRLAAFFVALCHALQEGEAELTATDAYWLGLIDEVIGSDLGSRRTMEEFQPDAPAGKAEFNEQGKTEAAA